MVEGGITQQKTAKTFGVSKDVIYREMKRYETEKESQPSYLAAKQRNIAKIKEHFGSVCQSMMDRIALGVTDKKIDDSSLRDSAIAFGIFGERMQTMTGINETIDHRHVLVGKVEVADSVD